MLVVDEKTGCAAEGREKKYIQYNGTDYFRCSFQAVSGHGQKWNARIVIIAKGITWLGKLINKILFE